MSAQPTLPALPVQDAVEFRHCVGFPGYCVGNDGSLWTCRRKGGNDRGPGRFTNHWRPMKLHRHGGYLRVNLVRDGVNVSRAVHCLVLEAFVGPCPPGMEGCHYPDTDKANNRLGNLRWDTHAENMRDRFRGRVLTPDKVCQRCRRARPRSDYYRDGRAWDGIKTECKACHTLTALATRDPGKKRRANREWMRRSRCTSA